jgi:glycolate oxidase FAD binding subunit
LTIDGLSPGRTLRPQSVEELSALVAGETGSIVPVGAGTQQEFGNPLRSFDCAIDVTGLNRITEYVPGDLTVHVEAGVTLDVLRSALAENNQFLPLDPWNGPSATIGGIAAANAQGAYRATGTIRDWIIGMKVVEVDGRISKTGGRVVKNVTGYDLAKLYTGSLGSLAIIAEISLKVRTSYGKTASAIARFTNTAEAANVLGKIRTSALQPVSCDWLGPENEVWLRFGEHPRAIDWQLKNLPRAGWRLLEGRDEADAWEALRLRCAELAPIVIKVVTLPSAMQQVIETIPADRWVAHALTGTVLLGVSDAAIIPEIRRQYRAVIERAPLQVRRQFRTFGLDDAEYALMRRMKDAFDPQVRLNPGRHVDGER